jgi:hypothetical protein
MTEFPNKVINYPFGEMDVQSVDAAATIELEVENQKTLVNVSEMAAAATINVTASPELKAGAELFIKLKSDGTARAVTLGTGFTGTSVAGTISKTKIASFVYDGSKFIHTALNQID